ncbi:MAG: DUF1080 domain-containing protein [Planctomycetes bacterium]|nr:DUF1080 domain-containing protein [Planctomycetota bacterium]
MISPVLLLLSIFGLTFTEPDTSVSLDKDTLQWQDLTPLEDLKGWKVCCGPARYEVKNGVVTGTTVPGSPNTFLITEKKYGDFELEYEFKVDSRLNAGVQIRSEVSQNRMRGCQIEIDMDENRQRFWSAGIYEEGDRGWLCDLSKNPEAIAAHNIDEWNHVRVVTRGAMIETYLNGVAAAKTWCGQRLKGVIGLQVHGVGAAQTEPLKVQWRRLKIRDHGEHQWVTVLDSSKTPSHSTDEDSPVSLWKFTPDSTTESLKLLLDLKEKQSWSFRQGDLSYQINTARNTFSFSFPPLNKQQDSGPMGILGSTQDRPWNQSRIFLHRNSWGVGYEILGPGGSGNSRKVDRFDLPRPGSGEEWAITASPGTQWQVQALIRKTASNSPQKP